MLDSAPVTVLEQVGLASAATAAATLRAAGAGADISCGWCPPTARR
ncbi:hypothetical protein [Kitasatospora sp. NPDC085879]